MFKGKKALWMVIAILLVVITSGMLYHTYTEALTTVKVQQHIQKVCDIEAIERIEYQSDDVTQLVKKDGIWENDELSTLKYNQQLMNEWISVLQNMETKEIVKRVQNMSVYGISEESTKITLYDGAGNVQVIRIGDIIESEDSLYIQCNEESFLYVVPYSAAKAILTRPNDFVESTDVLHISDVQSLTMDNGSQTMKLTYEGSEWRLRDYYKVPCYVSKEAVKDLLETVKNLSLDKYIGTYDNLEAYGLASPQLELVINEEIQVAFGSHSGGSVYVTVNNGQDIYSMDKKLYEEIVAFKPFEAIERQVVHLNYEQIKMVTLTNPQGTYMLDLNPVVVESTTQTSEKPLGEQEGAEIPDAKAQEAPKVEGTEFGVMNEGTAKLNGVNLSEEEAEEWLEKIKTSLWIEAQLQNPSIEQKEERKAEAIMEYTLKDNSIMQIELIPYDINYYILRYNGAIEFAVNKEKITKLFNEVTHFIKEA